MKTPYTKMYIAYAITCTFFFVHSETIYRMTIHHCILLTTRTMGAPYDIDDTIRLGAQNSIHN